MPSLEHIPACNPSAWRFSLAKDLSRGVTVNSEVYTCGGGGTSACCSEKLKVLMYQFT